MKRKLLALLCVAALLVSVLAACGPMDQGKDDGKKDDGKKDPTTECKHTFSDKWSSDAENHWHAATCEHGENKDSLAPHADADEDGKCDVCAYEVGHTHTFGEKWIFDGTYHWHAATCTHTGEKSDVALHQDANTDSYCDVCGNHTHIVDASGYCTVCDQKVTDIENPGNDDDDDDDNKDEDTTISEIIDAIIARSPGRVVSGKVVYENVIRGQGSEIKLGHTVDYSIFTDGTYTKRTEGDVVMELWMELINAENEEINAIYVESENGSVYNAEPVSVGIDDLYGYYYSVSTLADGYGAEAILKALYDLSGADTAKNYTVEINKENRTVKFTYSILIINTDTGEGEEDGVAYYEVEVGFGYSEDYILTSLNIVCDCYTNSLENEDENDYTYDQATQDITMKDGAKADTYTFTVTQTAGDRSAIDMEAAEDYIPESFELYATNDMANALTAITVPLVFDPMNPAPDVAVVCPEGTFIKFVKDALEISVTKNGAASSGLGVYLVGEVLQLLPNAAGEYTVTVTLGDFSKSFNVTVEGKSGGNDDPAGEHSFEFTGTDNNTFDGQLYNFVAPESGTYTFFIPAGCGAFDAEAYDSGSFSAMPYVDPVLSPEGGYFTVTIAKDDTYSFYIMVPTKNEPYTITYNYVAHEVDGGDDDDDDDQGGNETDNGTVSVGANSVIITQAEYDADTATRTFAVTAAGNYKFAAGALYVSAVTDAEGNTVAKNDDYTYTLEAGKTYTLTFSMLQMFGAQVGANELNVTNTSAAGGDDGGDEGSGVVEGTYTGTDAYGNAFLTVTVTADTVIFTFNHPMMGLSESYYTYAVVDGAVVLYDENGDVLNPLAGTLTIDADGTPVSADYNGNTYTLAAGGSEGGDGEGDCEITVSGTIYDEKENVVSITDDDIAAGKIYLSFMPYQSGEYDFLSNDFYISGVYDAEGNLFERNDNGFFELESYVTYNVEINTSWIYGAGDYTLTPKYEYPEGHQQNPFWLPWDYEYGNILTASYPGQYSPVWYSFVADETGVITVTSDNEKATLMITAEMGNEIQGYNSVSLNVIQGRQYFIGVADFDTFDDNFVNLGSDIDFAINFTAGEYEGDGSLNMPNLVILGENTASVPQWGCVWFAYKAEANGTLSLTTTNEVCAWYIKGIEEYATAGDKTVNVEKDSIYYIYIETSDMSAADIVFNVTLEADPTEIWYENEVFTDGTAMEMVLTDNTFTTITLNGTGPYTVEWDNTGANVETVSWGQPNAPVANGGTVTGQMYFGVTLKIYFPEYVAGTVNIKITEASAPAVDFGVGENTVSVTDSWYGTTVTLTADEAATYVIMPGTNAVVAFDYSNYVAGDTLEIALAAGESAELVILTEDYSTGDVTVTVAKKAAGEEGGASFTAGQYRYIDPASWKHRWVLVFNEDGTGYFAEQNYNESTFKWSDASNYTFTYTANEGGVTIDFADGASVADGTYSLGTVADNNGENTTGIVGVTIDDAVADFFFYE